MRHANPTPAVLRFYASLSAAATPRPQPAAPVPARFTSRAAEAARWDLLPWLLALVLALHCAEARPAADSPAAPVAAIAHL